MSRLITVENINFQINSIRLATLLLYYFFSFSWSSRAKVLRWQDKKKLMQLNEFFFYNETLVRLIDTFTRNEISQGADRVADKVDSIVRARFHPGARDVSLRLVRRLVSRLENARTSVHGVIPRIVTGVSSSPFIILVLMAHSGPRPGGCRAKRNWFSRRLLDGRSGNLNGAREWLAFAGKFAR